MRILYLGLPLGALHLARCGHPPVAIAAGDRRAPGLRRLRRELGPRGALLLARPDLTDAGVQHALATSRPDAILSFFWPRQVPRAVLDLAPRGAFGTHPSLLPRWRGPDPFFWAIRAGDARTGVTLHRLAPDYDTGPIVARREVPIADDDDAWQLARRLDRPALELLLECAHRLAAGETLEGTPQPTEGATWAPSPDDADLEIDWRRPAEEVARQVRAAAPWPGAHARIGDGQVVIARARVAEGTPPAALRPAEAWRAGDAVCVRASTGAVRIDRVRALDGRPLAPDTLLAASDDDGAGSDQAG